MTYHTELSVPYAHIEWCEETFGPTDILLEYRPSNRYADGLRWWTRQGHIFIRNEEDYMLYMLRWA